MTDRPIIFSGPMVRALMDGSKTQTRRVAKRQDLIDGGNGIASLPGPFSPWVPPYAPGDRLWVREAWKRALTEDGHQCAGYRADLTYGCGKKVPEGLHKWKPSIHMPRWASRLTLVVTDVRVQRVQEISEEDAKAEGIELFDACCPGMGWVDYSESQQQDAWGCPRESYRTLWDSLNAKRGFGWDANPWVVAISFDVHKCNIDALDPARIEERSK